MKTGTAVCQQLDSNGKEDMDEFDLPGFRFHPTEQELVGFYLKNMVQGKHFNTDVIGTLDLYRYDPWQLPSLARVRGEREWFFFVRRDCRINGSRPSRIAVSGYWKATGSDREVRNEKLKCIGYKKTLVFYIGRAPRGHRTDWLMNEYRMPPHSSISNLQIDAVVVCRIYRKAISLKSLDQRAARSKCDRYKPRGTISPCDDVKTAILTGQSSDSSYSAEENCIDGEPRINSVEDDRKNVTHSGLSSQGCHIVDDIDHLGMTTVELPFMEDDIHKVTPQGFPVWGSLSALMDSNSLRCCTSPDKESQVLVPKVSTDFCNEPSLAFLNYLDSNSWEELWASPSNIVCSAPSPLNLCCHNSSFDSSIHRQ